jgi:SAM-dependent methyltransferase
VFSKSAAFYDALYSFKDYKAEADFLTTLLRVRLGEGRLTVLDVACGTGAHIWQMREKFDFEGIDLDPGLLQIARERNRGVPFHLLDMAEFGLGKQFDAVLCLFSAIGYAKTLPRLQSTIQCFADHVRPGGLIVVEPWFTPDAWKPGTLHALHIDEPDLKLTRMSKSPAIGPGDIVAMEMHYLVGAPAGVEHFMEVHEMGMFTHDQYVEAFNLAGLKVERLEEGLMGRGVYVAIR